MNIKRYFILLTLFLSVFFVASAQENVMKMQQMQDSLIKISKVAFADKEETKRIEANFRLIKMLVTALKEKYSFNYGFPELKKISILNAPDKKFRIITWTLPFDDGSFRYYGAIQFKTPNGQLKLIPLTDKTFDYKEAEKEIHDPSCWFGAQYYELLAFSTDSYILLGWKGHTPELGQKVIEILQTDQDKVFFGKKVFEDDPSIVRKVFSFARGVNMTLQYDKDSKSIIFDHLISPNPQLKSDIRNNIPDLSFDAYRIENNRLYLKADVSYLRKEVDNQQNFIDPQSKKRKIKSGLMQ